MNAWPVAQKMPFTKKRLSKTVVLSYIFDYVIIVALIVGFYVLDAVEPYHQHFSLRNYTLQYPYAVKERVPVSMLIVYAVFAPAVIIAIYTLVIDGLFSHQEAASGSGKRRSLAGRYRLKDRLWELNCGILGLLLAVGAAFTITGSLKNAIGKPRPDLIDRCQPNITMISGGQNIDLPTIVGQFGLSNHSICTQTDNAILKDGFRSFPSGHSSTAFGGLFYLSLYLAAKMHVLDSKGEVWKTFIVMVPTLGAALIAGSRIMDARHHPFDVISGSMLGLLVAWASYRQYFPPVSETWRKGRAYPIRSWGKTPLPPNTVRRTDEGAEPLRSQTAPIDVERPVASGYSSPAVSDMDPNGRNVFREQISASQRQRAQQYGAAQPFSDPYTSAPARSGRPNDAYEYSSSEDEGSSAYELQPTYPLSDPRSHGARSPFETEDTAYHSQVPVQLSSIRPPVAVESGDLATPPPPPAHGEPARGVQLSESYA